MFADVRGEQPKLRRRFLRLTPIGSSGATRVQIRQLLAQHPYLSVAIIFPPAIGKVLKISPV